MVVWIWKTSHLFIWPSGVPPAHYQSHSNKCTLHNETPYLAITAMGWGQKKCLQKTCGLSICSFRLLHGCCSSRPVRYLKNTVHYATLTLLDAILTLLDASWCYSDATRRYASSFLPWVFGLNKTENSFGFLFVMLTMCAFVAVI